MAQASKQARRKHVPIRTCVVCRESRPQRDFTRLVRIAPQTLEIDLTGKLPGRGAYLCEKQTCWAEAAAGSQLGRALRMELSEKDRATIKSQAHKMSGSEAVRRHESGNPDTVP